MTLPNIFIIGSGNLAWHLIHAFKKANIQVTGLWSKNIVSLNEISQKFKIPILDEQSFFAQNGIYFLCVSDSSIEQVAAKCHPYNTIIHCAGSIPMSVITKYSPNSGVFYPLQTLTKNIAINFSEIPILIEYANDEVKQNLTTIAKTLNCKYYFYSTEQRFLIHIAAVFANNFSNFMFTLAQDFLQKHQINPNILNSLIKETASKAINHGAYKSQTGPSVRNDLPIIEKHLTYMNNLPELKNFYSFVSNYIFKYYQEKK